MIFKKYEKGLSAGVVIATFLLMLICGQPYMVAVIFISLRVVFLVAPVTGFIFFFIALVKLIIWNSRGIAGKK